MKIKRVQNGFSEFCNPGNLHNIRIGYIDSGFSYGKSRLKRKLNKIETVNLLNDDYKDNCGHGTMFADLLCRYFAGLPQQPVITAIKVSDTHRVEAGMISRGIKYAVENGIDILSINSAATAFDPEIAAALSCANEKGIICLAPAGNFLTNVMTYPASLETVIGCTCINEKNEIPEFANVNEFIDVCSREEEMVRHNVIASGVVKIVFFVLRSFGTLPGNIAAINSFGKGGTSSSLPAAVACAALAKSVKPDLDITGMRTILKSLPESVTLNRDGKVYCVRVLNIKKALNLAAKIGERIPNDREKQPGQMYFGVDKSGDNLSVEVFDAKGLAVKDLKNEIKMQFYEYAPFNRPDEYCKTLISEKKIGLYNGKLLLGLNETLNGKKYFLKISEDHKTINDAFTIV